METSQIVNQLTGFYIRAKLAFNGLNSNTITLPKSELQVAVYATRLKRKILKQPQFSVNANLFWSESWTVVQYIKNENQKFSSYIIDDVNEIK